jgi:hypothetical protein
VELVAGSDGEVQIAPAGCHFLAVDTDDDR